MGKTNKTGFSDLWYKYQCVTTLINRANNELNLHVGNRELTRKWQDELNNLTAREKVILAKMRESIFEEN